MTHRAVTNPAVTDPPVANPAVTDFPIQNLPYGVFRHGAGPPAIGVAIEDAILDLRVAAAAGLLESLPPETRRACAAASLNALMALTPAHWRELRARIVELLSGELVSGEPVSGEPYLVPMKDARMLLPATVGDYTDFYASIFHATNVGSLFRPDNPLLPNYKYVPVGYHGRASSIVLSGTVVKRPAGQAQGQAPETGAQLQPAAGQAQGPPQETGAQLQPTPRFGPSRALDYELEVGLLIGPGNPLGEPIPIASAEDHIFGICLVNDWSARDIQAWEYQPLGPFLSKSFVTSMSPWVVPLTALEPYRAPLYQRPEGDPSPLPYLDSARNRARGAIDLTLEVTIASAQMRERGIPPFCLSRGNLKDLYWSMAQMVAHHTSNGCNLRPGDLLATGTVSGPTTGPTRESRGCLLELTRRGAEPVTLPTGELRKFLEDGDEITLRGYCERPGLPRIGLGTCTGRVA